MPLAQRLRTSVAHQCRWVRRGSQFGVFWRCSRPPPSAGVGVNRPWCGWLGFRTGDWSSDRALGCDLPIRFPDVGDHASGADDHAPPLVAVPASLVRSLRREDRARLDEAVRMILPVSSRRLGVLNEGKTQGSARQYPLERIGVPTLVVSAADDLYRTLPNAREAATRIPHARLIDFATGGHLLLGRANELWPAVATFLQHEVIDQ